jgi:hypothetical protein
VTICVTAVAVVALVIALVGPAPHGFRL